MYFRHICKWLLQSHHNYKNIHLAAHFYSPLQLATAGSVIRFLLNLAFHLLSRIFSNISKVFGEECFLLQLVQKRGPQKKKEKKMKKNRILTSTSSTTCSLVGYKPLRVGHASPGGKYNWNFSITKNTKSAVKYFPIVYIYSLCLCFKYCLF